MPRDSRGLAAWVVSFAALLGGVACTRQDSAADPPATPVLATATASTQAPPALPIERPPPPEEPRPAAPRFVGRWTPDGRGMRCAWPGSYVVARFRGTRVAVRIKDEGFNLFQVVIDGEVKKVLRTDKDRGEAVYPLAEGLADGPHEIALHRRAEAKVGESVFYGFETDGALLPLRPPPERRIELLGDSITAGYGNEGPGATCGYVNSQQNEYLAYGALAARNLGADHTTIAWSGKSIHEMHVLFDKVLPQRTTGPVWDFAKYQPQVVVINLGTNNFANVDPGEALYVRVYENLVHTVRAAYPKALIVCALGSMLTNVFPEGRNALTQARKYMKVAVAKLRDAGDTNVELLEFPEQSHANGLGCGFHPSLKTHQLMSEQLTAFLKERMGW